MLGSRSDIEKNDLYCQKIRDVTNIVTTTYYLGLNLEQAEIPKSTIFL